MAKFLHNTQQRAFYWPALEKDGNVLFSQVLIGPGESVEISQEHFDGVRSAGGKGNAPIQALLDGRYLVYGDQPGDERIQLQTHAIEAPADLAEEKDERIKRESKKLEVAEIDLSSDEPTESKRSSRKA